MGRLPYSQVKADNLCWAQEELMLRWFADKDSELRVTEERPIGEEDREKIRSEVKKMTGIRAVMDAIRSHELEEVKMQVLESDEIERAKWLDIGSRTFKQCHEKKFLQLFVLKQKVTERHIKYDDIGMTSFEFLLEEMKTRGLKANLDALRKMKSVKLSCRFLRNSLGEEFS